ncbi:MAG: tetratricopeptide repeat protein [Pirellulales bacterium]|nr:tetratricopeptide repeat protein [Pirellulales bacterium]
MKTERRHELQTNQLADWMGNSVETAKPYTKLIAGVVVAAVVIFGSIYYLSRQTEKRQAEGWEKYFAAMTRPTPDQMQAVADAYRGTAVGSWARLDLADIQAERGTEALFQDRNEANQELRSAMENYRLVADEPAAGDIPRQRALLGLARASESLNQLDIARDAYNRLLKDYPNSAYSDEATQRLADLDRPATKAFYDWFALQDPKPPQEDLNPIFDGIQGLGGQGSSEMSLESLNLDFDPTTPAGDAVPAEGAGEPPADETSEEASQESAPAEETPVSQP